MGTRWQGQNGGDREAQRLAGRAAAAELASLERAALETMQLGVTIADLHGTILYTNPAEAAMHGYTVDELLGRHVRMLAPASLARPLSVEQLRTMRSWRREGINLRKDGSTFFVALSSDVARDSADEPVAIVTTCEDITERKEAEAAWRASEEREELALTAAREGLWDWDLRSNTIRFSPHWRAMLGLGEQEETPEHWLGLVHPDDAERVKADIARHVGNLGQRLETEHRIRHRDGTYRWVLTRGEALRDESGHAYRSVGSQADITGRKQDEERLAGNALLDPLTQLPNRAVFVDRLGRALERSRRGGAQRFAVLFLDLDRFADVNDRLGHPAGDRYLVEAGRRLAACLRPGDTVARFGGDEFAVLLDEVASAVDATRVAERIQKALGSPFALDGGEVCGSASIGIALSGSRYRTAEEILGDADTGMYRAKALGRACHQVFDVALHAEAMARLEMESDLRRALERSEFAASYQPVAFAATGQVCRVEASLAWRHPRRGLVTWEEFAPPAEHTGLIVPIGAWLLRKAACELAEARTAGRTAVGLAVRLSARQFRHEELGPTLDGILEQSGLAADLLDVEVAESTLMENVEASVAVLNRLKQRGVQLSIVEFGKGLSSLNRLRHFPVDALRMDRSFIDNLAGDPTDAAVVIAMIALGHGLGLRVAADGVETGAQLEFLRSHGCDEVQGGLIGGPAPGLPAPRPPTQP